MLLYNRTTVTKAYIFLMEIQSERLEIGCRIKNLRERLHLNQTEFADKCNRISLSGKNEDKQLFLDELKELKNELNLSYGELCLHLNFRYFGLKYLTESLLKKRFNGLTKFRYLEFVALCEVYKNLTGLEVKNLHIPRFLGYTFSQSLLSKFESGQRNLTLTEASCIIEVVGCNLLDLKPRGVIQYVLNSRK